MSEYIERGALLALFESAEEDDIELYGVHISDCFPAERASEIANTLPSADVVEVKHYCDALYALADMVNQFAYSTTFYGKEAVCDGGLSALEAAFWVLEQAGCKVNSNGTIQRANLFRFMDKMDGGADNG